MPESQQSMSTTTPADTHAALCQQAAELTAAAKNVAVGADPKEELDRVVGIADQELSSYR